MANLPRTASTKHGIAMTVKEVEKLDKLARAIALPIARLLDDDPGVDRTILVSEKVALDTEKAWQKLNEEYRKIMMKKTKNMLEGRGESKSRKPGSVNGEGSTPGT